MHERSWDDLVVRVWYMQDAHACLRAPSICLASAAATLLDPCNMDICMTPLIMTHLAGFLGGPNFCMRLRIRGYHHGF